MTGGEGSRLVALIVEPSGSGREDRAAALETRGIVVTRRERPQDVEPADLDPSPDLLVVSCLTSEAASLVASVLGDLELWPPLVVGLGNQDEGARAVMEAGADAFLEASIEIGDWLRFLGPLARRLQIRSHWRRMVERLVPLERAVGTMQIGLTIADPEGVVRYANAAEERMHGYGQGELVGLPARSLSTPDRSDPSGLRRGPTIRSWQRESINRRRDGTTFPVQLMSDLIFGPAGRLAAVVTTSEDITQRLEREARLRSLSKAVETMQVGLTITDLEGRILFVNPADARMHGYEPEELLGSDVGIYAGVSRRRRMKRDEIRLITSWQRESVNVAKNGRDFPVRLLSDVVLSALGEPLAIVTTCEDITERQRAEVSLKASEEKYRTIIENIEDGYYETDLAGRLGFFNEALSRIAGCSGDELRGAGHRTLMSPTRARMFLRTFNKVYRSGQSIRDLEGEIVGRDGVSRFVSLSVSLVTGPDGSSVGFRGIVRDISERKRAEKTLRESEERFRDLVTSAPALIWMTDDSNPSQPFAERWLNSTGRDFERHLGHPWAEAIVTDDRETCFEAWRSAWNARKAFRIEYRVLDSAGEVRWLLDHGTPWTLPDGTFAGYMGSCVDISDRKHAEEQLRHAALHDNLTGLPNRLLFLDRLGLALTRIPRRAGYGFGVLFIDLDRFKIINDSMGHAAGDRCLIEVGQRLVACVRKADTVCRLGGDEFAVLIDESSSIERLTEAAARIQEKLCEPMVLDGRSFFTSASIGIASTATGYTDSADIVRDADNAMYRAKALGGGRAEIFDRAMYRVAMARLETESELRLAMDNGQLELHYQPIVRLDSGRLAGFESLVRWRHPQRGMVLPGEFIPVAEETGLVRPIGSWVIKEAVRQIRQWNVEIPKTRDIRVTVNVSALQFDQGNLVDEIVVALRTHQVAPTSLGLEVTESAVLRNRTLTAKILAELRGLGVAVYLDDFGTGYSSLSLLHDLPVDTIKIDQSFVGRIGASGENSEIVQSVVALGHGLGLSVLAEGIETTVQLAQMRALRCEYGQGWYFHRAVSAAEATILLRDGLPTGITQGIRRPNLGIPRPPLKS